jgi:hypothetical protein
MLHRRPVERARRRGRRCSSARGAAIAIPLDPRLVEEGLDPTVGRRFQRVRPPGGAERVLPDLLAVETRQDLDPVEGIGAILRF